ncbi:hypothetical protein BCR35DRAFT_327969 [Leucosporidium creatinivorum]|uniref:Uncharacterized protein n=1 Tax=Leucosporidium creatinivorum TaxID=106004 RepID=A0A1Y2G4K3_9BASI|nr:hypothetical protein BCR35DRAFT_327969 [Leucosporidium creatinivorum]
MTRLNFHLFTPGLLLRAPPPPRFFAPVFSSSLRLPDTSFLPPLGLGLGARGFIASPRVGGNPQHRELFPPAWTPSKGAKWERESGVEARVEKVEMRREITPFAKTDTSTKHPTAALHSSFAAPAAPPSFYSPSNGGRPSPMEHSPIHSYLRNSTSHQRAALEAHALSQVTALQLRSRGNLRRSSLLYGTQWQLDPNFSDNNWLAIPTDKEGKTFHWVTAGQALLFFGRGLGVRDERVWKSVDRRLRRGLKKMGNRDVEGSGGSAAAVVGGNGATSAPAGGSPKGGAGRQDDGEGGPVSGGVGSGVTPSSTGNSGSIYLPWDLSSSRPKKSSRTFLGLEEWRRIEMMVDRGSSSPARV